MSAPQKLVDLKGLTSSYLRIYDNLDFSDTRCPKTALQDWIMILGRY